MVQKRDWPNHPLMGHALVAAATLAATWSNEGSFAHARTAKAVAETAVEILQRLEEIAVNQQTSSEVADS
jgi:hypothetical protein